MWYPRVGGEKLKQKRKKFVGKHEKNEKKRKLFSFQISTRSVETVFASYRAITVYGHLKIYIEVCGSRVRRVDYVSFLICTGGVHTPGYDPISPEGRLQTLILPDTLGGPCLTS